jgi:ribosome biogenesis GTPase A
MMEENIRLVDLVIELVDARIPLSSRNPDIDVLCRGKGRIVLLCKADLADPAKTERFEEYFRSRGILAVSADARERRAGDVVRHYVQEACKEKIARDRARGIVGRPLRAMVAGIPNVGKSTFINSFAGRASAKTGNKPGVTRGKQWIRMGGSVELLDTPGILWPKFDDVETGKKLAFIGSINDNILINSEMCYDLMKYLNALYPDVLAKAYETELSGDVYEDLKRIAIKRGCLLKGAEPDIERAAGIVINEFRAVKLGRLSLEKP